MRELLDGHATFHSRVPRNERRFLRSLASEGQSPDALFVGCSDSRVVPEILTNSSPGQLFVVRNIANLVPPLAHADASVGAAIEYAVGHLKVAHVIVCGHYGCGGVKAAIDGLDHVHALPSLHEWLGDVGQAVDRVRDPALAPTTLWRRAVEESVEQQLLHLMTYPCVAEAVSKEALEIHGWVYDLHTLRLWVFDPESSTFRRADELLSSGQTPSGVPST